MVTEFLVVDTFDSCVVQATRTYYRRDHWSDRDYKLFVFTNILIVSQSLCFSVSVFLSLCVCLSLCPHLEQLELGPLLAEPQPEEPLELAPVQVEALAREPNLSRHSKEKTLYKHDQVLGTFHLDMLRRVLQQNLRNLRPCSFIQV